MGLLIVYTGQGKGKTTAALGLVFRALGRGKKVAIVQFIKGKWETGERLFAERLSGSLAQLPFHVMGLGFTWESDDLSRDKQAAREAWEKAKSCIEEGQYDIVVLDELTYVIHYNFVTLEEILLVLKNRPANVHVVVTGRKASPELISEADLVTEMNSIKHPYEKGIPAVKGIDF